jgi:hypothetical protein
MLKLRAYCVGEFDALIEEYSLRGYRGLGLTSPWDRCGVHRFGSPLSAPEGLKDFMMKRAPFSLERLMAPPPVATPPTEARPAAAAAPSGTKQNTNTPP